MFVSEVWLELNFCLYVEVLCFVGGKVFVVEIVIYCVVIQCFILVYSGGKEVDFWLCFDIQYIIYFKGGGEGQFVEIIVYCLILINVVIIVIVVFVWIEIYILL